MRVLASSPATGYHRPVDGKPLVIRGDEVRIVNRSVLDWPTGVTLYKPEKCYNGCTVVNPFLSRTVYLIDMMGRVVHQWEIKMEEPLYSIFLEKQANESWLGLLARAPEGGWGRPQFGVVQLDWDSSVVWRYVPPEGTKPHHDAERLQNGNTLVLLNRLVERPRISAKVLQDEFFIELDRDGQIVWEWHTSDHFDEFGYSDEARRLMYEKGGDIFHNNTLTALPGSKLGEKDSRFAKGNILGSQRHTNIIYVIDKSTEEVVWKWGDGENQLVGQHHPTMLDNGNILIYDNGGRAGYPTKCRFYTRLLKVNPATCEIVWEYRHDPLNLKETQVL